MKPLPTGYRALFETVVTEAMTVDFQQPEPGLGRLHPVYATYWLTRHMELVSRKLILPFLEPGEEGIGYQVTVRHLAPTLPGMRVRLEATHIKTEGNRVHVRCEAFNELDDRIGEGSTTQAVLTVTRLEQGFAALRRRWEVARE